MPARDGVGCLGISIHAPVKGATCAWWTVWTTRMHFNPRSRKGSDLSVPQDAGLSMPFQSTLP